MRTVGGLDVHKDSIFMCVLDEQGKKNRRKIWCNHPEDKTDGVSHAFALCE